MRQSEDDFWEEIPYYEKDQKKNPEEDFEGTWEEVPKDDKDKQASQNSDEQEWTFE